MSDERAKRRRAERDARRQIIVGEGIIATTVPGETYVANPQAELPAKVPGQHRWIATAGYVLDMNQVYATRDPDMPKFLDEENLFMISVGCYDCEQPIGVIEPDSHCPAPAGP